MTAPLQRYKILEKLGAGGMAEIYRGEAQSIEGFKKQVAIKRVLPNLTKHEKFTAMFLDEARLSLRLNHANVVQVFDIGRAGNTYFLVMEFIDGLNLRQFITRMARQKRPIPVAYAIFLTTEVCKGLSYAHDMVDDESGKPLRIVHRDVTPPNVLLSRMGEVKLTDFGLAKAATQIEDTEPGVVKGKFSYLSPEAASGKNVDRRSDIFSCGILLWEMLSGKRLFQGKTDWDTVELVRKAKIPSVVQLNPEIPAEMEDIVHKALARDPDDRFQQAFEFGDRLAQFLFKHGMKVTSRDLSVLVRECRDLPGTTGLDQRGHIVQAVVKKEIRLFDTIETGTAMAVRQVPTIKFKTKDMIDTSNWASEFVEPTPPSMRVNPAGGKTPMPVDASPPADDRGPPPLEAPSLKELEQEGGDMGGDTDQMAIPFAGEKSKLPIIIGLMAVLAVLVIAGVALL